MNWLEILNEIFRLCIVPLLAILTRYLIVYIETKKEDMIQKNQNEMADKYITMLADTISDCVQATNQTYVDSLKQENIFDAEAQKEAFNKTYEAVMAVLSEDAKKYLATIYGDLNSYITQKIESEVKFAKKY